MKLGKISEYIKILSFVWVLSTQVNAQVNITKDKIYETIKKEMSSYKRHPRIKWKEKIIANFIPKYWNSNYYYWYLGTKNIEGTFIDSSLVDIIPNNIEKKWNHAYLKRIKWKFVVLVYINWELKLASYASPWNSKHKWAIRTLKWNFTSDFESKYWVSWARVSKWAPMPYAVHIVNWIFSHAWVVNWERKSHWCVRLPLYYAKWLYDIFKEYKKL